MDKRRVFNCDIQRVGTATGDTINVVAVDFRSAFMMLDQYVKSLPDKSEIVSMRESYGKVLLAPV